MMSEHGGWICPDCGEMNNLPTGERCDCEQDEQELEYMPIEMTIGRYEFLVPWEDVYEPDEIGTSDHYYRALDKPSPDDEWWLDSQEEDDEQETS